MSQQSSAGQWRFGDSSEFNDPRLQQQSNLLCTQATTTVHKNSNDAKNALKA